MNWTTLLLILVVILIIIFIIYLLSWEKCLKPIAVSYVTDFAMKNVKMETNPNELTISESKTYATLKYTHLNKEYTLYLPYDKKLLRKVGTEVIHHLDGVETDISSQPGIPCLVNASALGG